ncbi:MAG TPA: hypothetical protein VMJ70_16300 [Candidatus Sulfotelmatobacter sp.]|nr:hypothetical protein [Candidatus Sulfotelmatobacter sp.]
MKNLRLAALAAGLLLATRAEAQLPSPYTGAAILPVDGHVFGGYVPISQNVVGLLGQLRLSFYPGVDFGFQGGLSRMDRDQGNRTLVQVGTDVKVALLRAGDQQPFDIAAGGGLGIHVGDNYSALTLGPTIVASRSWHRGATGEISPYVGLGFAFSSVNSDQTRTDFSTPLRVGSEFGLSPVARIVTEFEFRLGDDFNDDVGFSAGVNLPF